MTRVARSLMVLLLLAFAAPLLAGAQEAAAPPSVKGDMLMWIKDAEDKLTQLAAATPEAKYSWRPAKGVRSTGEVFMHVAAANFGIPSFSGAKPPEGFAFETYEKSLTKKADIEKALKDSFAHLEKALMDAPDEDMNRQVDLFGMKLSVRSTYMLLLSHCHEHLGQSIAYARSNGIVPPWTAKTDAMIKEQADKKKAASN